MARTPVWRRSWAQNNTPSTFGQILIDDNIPTGYTLDRLVFTVDFQGDVQTPQALWQLDPTVFGLIVMDGSPPPVPPYPLAEPGADWLWWERISFESEWHPEDGDGYARFMMRDAGRPRETNGKRKIAGNHGNIWLCYQNGGLWPKFGAQVGISALWLLP